MALSFVATSFAGVSTVIVPTSKPTKPNASEIMISIGGTGQKISLLDLSTIKTKDVEKLTGKKMKLIDKVGFKIAQKQLRSSINPDGTINNNKLAKAASKKAPDGSGFHLGGFALGFLLGLIGVLIAYLINDDLKSTRTKWAWIGFGVVLVLYLIIVLL